ncbi:hypothetical protein C1930_19245 [Stenotrophomonas sp. SAU14A_NAIMI4_8]|nr:hypothetical protein C1930_19245 [Stenotrophomonas sp. SAU14A_NAIMI4_8]HAL21681.1 hypothetical protein [Stenotrophomonas sp.]
MGKNSSSMTLVGWRRWFYKLDPRKRASLPLSWLSVLRRWKIAMRGSIVTFLIGREGQMPRENVN